MDIVKLLRTRPLYEGCGEGSNIPDDAADEIERLRLANSDLQMYYDYARTECDKLQAEVLRLRGSLASISMLTPLSGQSWESYAKLITAYVIDELKEKE